MKKLIRCSIGITAYNEGKNISILLGALARQKLRTVIIDEILVISSGSTDNTDSLVQNAIKKDPRIRLITETKRNGKASAVNMFIDNARNEVLVLESADTIPSRNAIEQLVAPFHNKEIGITGSHPIPINASNTVIGYAVNCEWALHHEISLKHPKMGETVAFRKSFKKIPVLSAVDEVNIEALIKGQGYKALYIPDAIVRNKGPETLHEFIEQRRRIYAGHLATKREYSYSVSTIHSTKIFFILIKRLFKNSIRDIKSIPAEILFTGTTIAIEAYARFMAYIDFKFKDKDYSIWQVAPSTKSLTTENTLRTLPLQLQPSEL